MPQRRRFRQRAALRPRGPRPTIGAAKGNARGGGGSVAGGGPDGADAASGAGADVGAVAGVLVWTEASRFAAMRDFYAGTLGLTPRADRAGPRRLRVGWPAPHDRRPRTGCAVPPATPLRVMVNFGVGDIEAVHARLRGAGVAFSRPPGREPWGGLVATFADPDGNTLQLLQLPPGR